MCALQKSIDLRPSLALALGVGLSACQPGEPAPLSEPEARALECSEAECALLAGPCQVAQCDPITSACRVSAAAEGEPCLPGNGCGPAACGSGQCLPLAPPACAELDDTCHVGRCDPVLGACVAKSRAVPGASCDSAVRLELDSSAAAPLDAGCSPSQSEALPGCWGGGRGASARFELDLRGAQLAAPVIVSAIADVPIELGLTRGPCNDPVLESCGAPLFAEGTQRWIQTTLPPERHFLTVSAPEGSAPGTVQVMLAHPLAACSEPPAHDACDSAARLEPALHQQLVIGPDACATPSLTTRCEQDATWLDVFYELDLSGEAQDRMLEVRANELNALVSVALFEGSACDRLLTCGSAFARRVSPGRYTLRVAQPNYFFRSPALVSVVHQAPDCSATANDTPQAATALDPSLETQTIVGNTACARPDFVPSCAEDRGAPDLFYSLDLRNRDAVTELSWDASAGWRMLVAVSPDAGALVVGRSTCLNPRSGLPVWLAPRRYILVVDGELDDQGKFELTLQQRQHPFASEPLGCDVVSCQRDSEPACSDSLAEPACLAAAVECGLPAGVYTDYCTRFPDCCAGAAERGACLDAWQIATGCAS